MQQGVRSCAWCGAIHKTNTLRPRKVFCNVGCRDAEQLFELMFSDEEINRREHYRMLTTGGENG